MIILRRCRSLRILRYVIMIVVRATSQMVPDTEVVCQTSEAPVDSGDMLEQIKDRPENEVTSMTAWKRYQQLVSMLEFNDGEFNQRSMIEEIFRGTDLIYASH